MLHLIILEFFGKTVNSPPQIKGRDREVKWDTAGRTDLPAVDALSGGFQGSAAASVSCSGV